MPDFLHGDYATAAMMGDIPKLLEWIEKVGTTEVVSVNKGIYRKYFINFEIWIQVTPDVERSVKYLKEAGVDAATLVGFCWGAKIAVQLTTIIPFFVGASLIHPSFVDVKDAEKAGAPILALPSKDEPDMTEYMQTLAKKPFGSQCKHVRFDDMPHGFCASRSNYTDKLNAQRATEAIQLTVNFFSECFKAKESSL